MDDQPLKFHATYADLVAGLPPSQLKEARKRLMACKQQPLTAEEVVGEHPKVLACLEKIAAAYKRKKTRSSVASKCRRDAVREKLVRTNAGSDADVAACCYATVDTSASEPAVSELTSSLAECTVECTPEAAAESETVVAVPVAPLPCCLPSATQPEEPSEPPATKASRPVRGLVRPAVPAAAATAATVATQLAKSLAKKASGSTLVSRRR